MDDEGLKSAQTGKDGANDGEMYVWNVIEG